MTWAVAQKCGSPSSKLVLLMLADHCNGHTGQCNPRHKRLAEACEMRVETLKDHLRKLEALGLITIVAQFAEGVQLPNQYILNLDVVGANTPGGGGEKHPGGGGEKHPGGGGEKHPGGGGEKHPPNNQEDNQEDNHLSSPDKSGDQNSQQSTSTTQPATTKQKLPACPHLELLDIFAEKLPELPQPKPELWEGARAKALAARWKWCLTAKKRSGERYATTKAEALDFFERYFGYVAKSDFLTGRDGRWSGCDLAWLVKADNFAKVLQGNYENRQ